MEHRVSQGLSEAEVLRRRAQGQGNNIRVQTSRSYAEILRENVFTFINNVLFVLGIALVLLGRTSDAVVSVGVILINVVVSVVQEVRAKRTLDRIALLTRPTATVIRGGQEKTIDPSEIVIGELLAVGPGDQIVVDGVVIGEGHIDVDESLLTGESDLIPKKAGDEVLSGSFCVNGRQYYEASRVGNQSFANKLTSGARAFRRVLTPIQTETNLVIRILLLIAVYFEFLLLVDALLNRIPFVESVKMSVVIAGLVPNGLFVAIALSYALGAVRIAGKGALVQQANAVESLSNVNVLCMDKTGTLTANRLLYHGIHPLESDEEGLRTALGDYVTSAAAGNRTSEAIATACPGEKRTVVDEVAFSSERKWSGLTLDDPQRKGVYVLGAPEMILPSLREGSELGGQARQWTEQGLRVLLFAHHPEPSKLNHDGSGPKLPPDMQPLGLVSLSDELRPGLTETLAEFRNAGVMLKVISGDNPHTVAALARQAGFGEEIKIVSGLELAEMQEGEFAEAADTCTIFGRITPQQKERLVQTLRGHGNYVAMIGDGVNDVLSLKQSNLGIAMQSGSQATRGVADIILLGDSFDVLPHAVNEGQRIINGMHDILRLFLSRTFFVALAVLSTSILGGFPFTPKQSSIMALAAVGLPSIALAAWARPGVVPKGSLIRRMLHFVLPASLSMSIFGLLIFGGFLLFGAGGLLETGAHLERYGPAGKFLPIAQTALTSFSILCGLLLIVFVEPPSRHWVGGDTLSDDRRPAALALVLFIAYLVFLAVPSLSSFFDFARLSFLEHLAIMAWVGIWALVLRGIWRQKSVERFFGVNLE